MEKRDIQILNYIKMIARTVHKHTPQEQLQHPFFNQFVIDNIETGEHVMDVNRLPKYF